MLLGGLQLGKQRKLVTWAPGQAGESHGQGEAGHAGADDVAQLGRGLIKQILQAAAQLRQGQEAIGRIEARPLQGRQALVQVLDAAGAACHLAHLLRLLAGPLQAAAAGQGRLCGHCRLAVASSGSSSR